MSKYTYFTLAEFDSPDQPGSGEKYMDRTFVRRLDKARGKAGIAFIIISGARTKTYNAKVGGFPGSTHEIKLNKKVADADIDYNTEEEKVKILQALVDVGFNRFGIRTGKSGSSIHVDSDETKPQFAVWGYNKVSPGYKFDSNKNFILLV